MPSDTHSFNELKVRFIFVPQGEPEPAEVTGGHADWIRLPATLDLDEQTNSTATQTTALLPAGRPIPTGRQAASPEDDAPEPPSGRHTGADTGPTPNVALTTEDPVAAYRQANNALLAVSATATSKEPGHDADPMARLAPSTPDTLVAPRTNTDEIAASRPPDGDAGPGEAQQVPIEATCAQHKPLPDNNEDNDDDVELQPDSSDTNDNDPAATKAESSQLTEETPSPSLSEEL
jgi:hypothetical protein